MSFTSLTLGLYPDNQQFFKYIKEEHNLDYLLGYGYFKWNTSQVNDSSDSF